MVIQQEWHVQTPTGRCAATQRPIAEGDPFYAVLFEQGDSFRRADYSVESWSGPPKGCYCYFKTQMPVKSAKRKKVFVDDELLIEFFRRLESDPDPARLQFRFVLGLILLRKRVFRFDGSSRENNQEVWNMTLMRDRSEHRLINPELTADQTVAVNQQLGAILHGDMGEWSVEGPAGESAGTIAPGSA